MKYDSIEAKKNTITFNKAELIEMMIERYQKASGVVLEDINKKNCRIMANSRETHHVELVFAIEKIEGKDYNGI